MFDKPPQQILDKWEDIIDFRGEDLKKISELGRVLQEGNVESTFDIDTMKLALDDDIWEFYAVDQVGIKVQVDWDGIARNVHYTDWDRFLYFEDELRELIYEDSHPDFVKDLLELDVIDQKEFETWQKQGSIEGLTKADIAIMESQALLRFHNLAKEFQEELEANPHAFEKHPMEGYSVSYYSKDRDCYYRISEDESVIHLSRGTVKPSNLEKDWHYNHATQFLKAELAKTQEDAIKRMVKEQKKELSQKVVRKPKGMTR